MRKLLLCSFFIFPMMAFAEVSISDCVIVGYQKGTMTENDCNTVTTCNVDYAEYPEDLDRCLKHAKTPKECREYIAAQNAKIEKDNLVYRCPVNTERLEQKAKVKDHTNHDLVYLNGKAMNLEELATDTRYVYIFHEKSGLPGFISLGKYSIIGPAEKYGLNMVYYE